ncbi:MAG: diguanylate phosphodiesterase, partial [Mesorhizobium sp.]|nr:diguanylate phosphodiesterase [Mesorhizobium sp.]
MSAFRATAQAMNVDKPDDITEDVYVGFVRSLFENASLLFVAAFSQAVIGTLVYLKTSAPIYIVLTFLMVGVTLGRYYAIQRVKRETIVTYQSALEWERYYLIAGTIHGAVVGFFAFTSLYIAPSLFGEVAAISMVLASAITIAGRNFGSRKMVVILTVSVIAPIALGLMLKGDIYNFILGLFIIP